MCSKRRTQQIDNDWSQSDTTGHNDCCYKVLVVIRCLLSVKTKASGVNGGHNRLRRLVPVCNGRAFSGESFVQRIHSGASESPSKLHLLRSCDVHVDSIPWGRKIFATGSALSVRLVMFWRQWLSGAWLSGARGRLRNLRLHVPVRRRNFTQPVSLKLAPWLVMMRCAASCRVEFVLHLSGISVAELNYGLHQLVHGR